MLLARSESSYTRVKFSTVAILLHRYAFLTPQNRPRTYYRRSPTNQCLHFCLASTQKAIDCEQGRPESGRAMHALFQAHAGRKYAIVTVSISNVREK